MLGLLVAFGAAAGPSLAADAPLAQEVHELRRDVQMQAKKLDALSDQILKLTQLMEAAKAAPPPPPVPAPIAKAATPTPVNPTPAAPEIARAEAAPPVVQHVVEKGETLTSIAKHYNIPLTDLQTRNKITNDRKLQIGQTLLIPNAKDAEPSAEKKDHP